MATSHTSGEFARRMVIIAQRMRENVKRTVQRAAIAADQTVVIKTPVDTGRARANWLVSIGAPTAETVEGYSANGAANQATEQGRSAISGYKLGQGGIFITNNVVYTSLLDAGSSMQAPAGMTAAAIVAARKQFGDARLLEGV